MKKLGKLSINPDKVMKNDELVSLRGGYGGHYVSCKGGSVSSGCGGEVESCSNWQIRTVCDFFCPGWTSAVCV